MRKSNTQINSLSCWISKLCTTVPQIKLPNIQTPKLLLHSAMDPVIYFAFNIHIALHGLQVIAWSTHVTKPYLYQHLPGPLPSDCLRGNVPGAKLDMINKVSLYWTINSFYYSYFLSDKNDFPLLIHQNSNIEKQLDIGWPDLHGQNQMFWSNEWPKHRSLLFLHVWPI